MSNYPDTSTGHDRADHTDYERARSRPVGVWIFTIWIAILAGVVPAVAITFAYSRLDVRESLGLTFVHFLLSILLALAIIIAATLAWLGNKFARYGLVLLASIHYLLIASNGIAWVNSGVLDDSQKLVFIGRSVRNVIWVGILVWYFIISKRTDKFYSDNSSIKTDYV